MSCGGKKICIVGSRWLQNELLAIYIGGATGLVVDIEDSLFKVPQIHGDGTDNQRLLLLDCMDMSRETLDGMLVSSAMRRLTGDIVVLFNLSYFLDIEREALFNGVRGFVYENDRIDTFLKMMDVVFRRELWVSRKIMTKCLLSNSSQFLSFNAEYPELSSREIEILTSVATGHSNSLIADKLCISPHTVKTHVYNIFKKINVSSRVQAAQWASRYL